MVTLISGGDKTVLDNVSTALSTKPGPNPFAKQTSPAEFHGQVLDNGALPLEILEKQIRESVAARNAR